MPRVEHYEVDVTVSVVVRSVGTVPVTNPVAEYSVTRTGGGVSDRGAGLGGAVQYALEAATAAEKALRAGVQNAEGRRLK